MRSQCNGSFKKWCSAESMAGHYAEEKDFVPSWSVYTFSVFIHPHAVVLISVSCSEGMLSVQMKMPMVREKTM